MQVIRPILVAPLHLLATAERLPFGWFKLVETSGTRRYLFSAASANTGSPYNWILGFAVLDGQLC